MAGAQSAVPHAMLHSVVGMPVPINMQCTNDPCRTASNRPAQCGGAAEQGLQEVWRCALRPQHVYPKASTALDTARRNWHTVGTTMSMSVICHRCSAFSSSAS